MRHNENVRAVRRALVEALQNMRINKGDFGTHEERKEAMRKVEDAYDIMVNIQIRSEEQ